MGLLVSSMFKNPNLSGQSEWVWEILIVIPLQVPLLNGI